MRGACLDALSTIARPSTRRLKGLGTTGNRLVAVLDDACVSYCEQLRRAAQELALVLTGASFPSDEHRRGTAATYARLLCPEVVLVGNEWNVLGDASWPIGDVRFIDLWNTVAPAIREGSPETALYVGGMYSEDDTLGHLARVWDALDPTPDGVDFHPYRESVDEVRALLTGARARFGCQVAVFEWNWADASEIGPFQALLDELTEHSCWIPFATGQIPDLPGLYRNGRLTKLGRTYRTALRGSR